MGDVAVTIKIMPNDINVNLDLLKNDIIKNLPQNSKVYGDWKIQPIAFGLNSLVVTILVEDGDGGITNLEESILKTNGTESIQILEMGRV